jgi:hypothetical protein
MGPKGMVTGEQTQRVLERDSKAHQLVQTWLQLVDQDSHSMVT